MILIFGGAYNGKLEFVKRKYKLNSDDIFYCRNNVLEYEKKVICGLHIFIKECLLNNLNPLDILEENINKLEDKIIICDEIGSGIVPIEKIDRIWREETGKALQYLIGKSDYIYRIFFGIEEELGGN